MKLIKKFESWTGTVSSKSKFTQEDMDIIWETFQDVVSCFNIVDMEELPVYATHTNCYRIRLARNAWVEFILYENIEDVIEMLKNNIIPVLRHEGFELIWGDSQFGDSIDGMVVNNDVDYDGNPLVEVLLTIKKS